MRIIGDIFAVYLTILFLKIENKVITTKHNIENKSMRDEVEIGYMYVFAA